MDQYKLIRTAHRRYGKNISELSRMTGHSRNTIRKALKGESFGYNERTKQPFPQLGPFLSTINSWPGADKNHPKKQRHTARRIYNRLVAECGFQGGESTVRGYVRLSKTKLGLGSDGAFVLCDPAIGEEAEIDQGNEKAIIGG